MPIFNVKTYHCLTTNKAVLVLPLFCATIIHCRSSPGSCTFNHYFVLDMCLLVCVRIRISTVQQRVASLDEFIYDHHSFRCSMGGERDNFMVG
jgi:hypothetical protein